MEQICKQREKLINSSIPLVNMPQQTGQTLTKTDVAFITWKEVLSMH